MRGAQEVWEDILEREVDLITERSAKNPHFRTMVEKQDTTARKAFIDVWFWINQT